MTLLAVALTAILASTASYAAPMQLTGRAGQPHSYDFGDPSPPDLTDPNHVRVYTTGGAALVWPRGPVDNPLKFLLSAQGARQENLEIVHHDGTPFSIEDDGEDVWDPTVERSLENPTELILYGGAMKPNPGEKTAVWPQDNWRRRTFAFVRRGNSWVMSKEPLFDDPSDDVKNGTWVGHNYGHAFLKDERGATYVFYERVTEERNGLPWRTELFARKMVSSFRASEAEISILKIPKKYSAIWPAARRTFGGSLIEGPRPFKIGGLYFISFSAGEYTSDDYGIHLAWSKELAGPYLPYLNRSQTNLFDFGSKLEAAGGKLHWGAARGSFFEDRGKWWVLYHGIETVPKYVEDGLRNIYLAPVTIQPVANPKEGHPPFEILLEP